MSRVFRPIAIEYITEDSRLQGRPLKKHLVDQYANGMRRYENFPPISIVRDADDNYFLVDGYHRVAARRQLNGLDTIDAEIIEGTFDDALCQSWAANRDHGLRRTQEQIRAAIRSALKHPLWKNKSDRAIGDHIGCDHKTVGRIRKLLRKADRGGEFPSSKAKPGSSRAQILKAARLIGSVNLDQHYPFEEDELAALSSALDSLSDLFATRRALAA